MLAGYIGRGRRTNGRDKAPGAELADRRSLKALVYRARVMMLLLIPYILDHPFEVLASEGYDAVAALPLQSFRLYLVIDKVGA